MTDRFEKVMQQLSPEQIESLLAQAEAMANQPRPRGRKLSLRWANSIDSEHTSGLDAQKSAMTDWMSSIERKLNA